MAGELGRGKRVARAGLREITPAAVRWNSRVSGTISGAPPLQGRDWGGAFLLYSEKSGVEE